MAPVLSPMAAIRHEQDRRRASELTDRERRAKVELCIDAELRRLRNYPDNPEPKPDKYPRAVRVAIVLGSAAALWAGIVAVWL